MPLPPAQPLAAWINPPDNQQAALRQIIDQRALLLPLPLAEPFASFDLIESERLALSN
jgi:hypothetical protein